MDTVRCTACGGLHDPSNACHYPTATEIVDKVTSEGYPKDNPKGGEDDSTSTATNTPTA